MKTYLGIGNDVIRGEFVPTDQSSPGHRSANLQMFMFDKTLSRQGAVVAEADPREVYSQEEILQVSYQCEMIILPIANQTMTTSLFTEVVLNFCGPTNRIECTLHSCSLVQTRLSQQLVSFFFKKFKRMQQIQVMAFIDLD